MAMYRHFADKDALIDALMLDGLGTWEDMVAAVRTKDPIKWIERVCEAYVNFAIADPHRFDAAFLLPARGARRYPNDFIAKPSAGIQMLFARLQAAQDGGVPLQLPIERIAPILAGIMQGMASLHRAGRFASDADFRRLAKAAVHDFLMLATRGNAP